MGRYCHSQASCAKLLHDPRASWSGRVTPQDSAVGMTANYCEEAWEWVGVRVEVRMAVV